MTSTAVTDAMVTNALPTVRWLAQAVARRGLPPGINVEDLESVGDEALVQAAATFDPQKYTWVDHVKAVVRSRMKDEVRAARTRASRSAPVEFEAEDGDFLPRPDPRVSQPGDLAAAREAVATPGVRTVSLKRTRGNLPTPDAVAEKVAALREAMFAAVKTDDVSEVMATIVAAAKKGDLKAAKLLLDYLQPGRSGVVVQQAVVVNAGDLE